MNEIFVGQSALRIEVDTNLTFEELDGALSLLIKYTKPSGSAGSFIATEDTTQEGIIYYDVVLTNELDESGKWQLWSYVQFADTRIAQGIPVTVIVNVEGAVI